MTDAARVVIVGGGVAGTSIAYHLGELGWTDVLLVERDQLTSGSTFHSAGLVGQLRSSVTLTRMMMYGVELYRRLGVETGQDPGWHEVGSLRLASSPARVEELRRQAGWARSFGLPLEVVSAERAHALFHGLFDPEGVLAAAWLPTDGHLNPSDLTMALAAGARGRGVTLRTGVRVTGIGVERGRVVCVDTDQGRVSCEHVVLAGGIYAWELGRLAGVEIPLVPMAHQYAVVRTAVPVRPDLPTMRDPDRLVYFREDVGGIVLGGYERDPAPWSIRGVPADFNNRLLQPDWDRFLPLSEAAGRLVPAVADAEVVRLVNGPEAFTPDGEFLLGETEVGGLHVAAGFCAHGIAGAGGVGKVMAESIVGGEAPVDLWRMDVRRFGAAERSRRRVVARATEVYASYYDVLYPNHERQAGRPLRVSGAFARHTALGAVLGEKAGWERANWYSSNEDPAHERFRPRGWAGEHWSTAIVTEHLATRSAAGLFDESSFSKLEVSGPGAAAFLEGLCANRVARGVGAVTYTQLLNSRGGIECDLTVTRQADDRFLLVTGTAFGGHDLSWLERHAGGEAGVAIRDVTSSLTCFALWGPAARVILSPLTDDDLGFGYMAARPITVADVPLWALRVTYVGELGWELYCPPDFSLPLWDVLMEAGTPHGLLPCGYRAIDSLRLEKGYRVWSSDITPDRDPISAGLGFAVRMDKPGGFLGRDALARLAGSPQAEQLCCLVLDDPRAVALGNEAVLAGGATVGRVTSGGVGYSVGASIAYAWLPARYADAGTPVDVEVFGELVGATVVAGPLVDPAGERVRA